MDAVLGHKPATQPSVVVECAAAAAAVVEEDSNEDGSLLLQEEEELSDIPRSSASLTETTLSSNQSACSSGSVTPKEGNKSKRKERERTRPVDAKLSKWKNCWRKW
jgi:hypothetical protein